MVAIVKIQPSDASLCKKRSLFIQVCDACASPKLVIYNETSTVSYPNLSVFKLGFVLKAPIIITIVMIY